MTPEVHPFGARVLGDWRMSAEGATDDRRSGSGWRSRAHRGRLHRRAKRCLPHARRSRLSAGGATRVSRLPPRSGSRPPPSVDSQAPWPQPAFRARARQPVRRYEPAAPDEIVHIGIKKLGRFNRIGHRITGDRAGRSSTRGVGWGIRASGGRRPFASGLLGNPARREAKLLACAFCSTPCASFAASASRSSAS